jgi:predicted glycoside hydrolase/deacetylase ChbG (UPF0249 family)
MGIRLDVPCRLILPRVGDMKATPDTSDSHHAFATYNKILPFAAIQVHLYQVAVANPRQTKKAAAKAPPPDKKRRTQQKLQKSSTLPHRKLCKACVGGSKAIKQVRRRHLLRLQTITSFIHVFHDCIEGPHQ